MKIYLSANIKDICSFVNKHFEEEINQHRMMGLERCMETEVSQEQETTNYFLVFPVVEIHYVGVEMVIGL